MRRVRHRAGRRPSLAQAQPKWADPAKTLRVTFPDRGDGLRSAGDVRLLLEPRRARDLRAAVHVRLSRAAAPDHPEHRGGDARDLGGRPHVEDPHPPGHLLHRRSGVQGQEARARRRRLRLCVQAAARPEGCARRSCGSSTARSPGPTTCSRRRRRPGGSTTTLPIEGLKALDRYTLQITLKEPDYVLQGYLTQIVDGGGRARGDRSVRRRVGLGDGESGRHRAVPAEGVAARAEDRARGESGLSRRVLSRRAPSPPIASSSRR